VKFARAASFKPLPRACAPKGKVQLDPEAIEAIHAAGTTPSAQGLGYTGAGVKVAYIADGINVDDPDFIRANGTSAAARSLTLTQAGDYETTVTFTVPTGQARLSASVTAATRPTRPCHPSTLGCRISASSPPAGSSPPITFPRESATTATRRWPTRSRAPGRR
jgi:hypothetical protein